MEDIVFFYNYIGSFTSRHKFQSYVTFVASGLLAILLFFSNTINQVNQTKIPLIQDFDWYTLVELDNEGQPVSRSLKLSQVISDQDAFNPVRLIRTVVKVDLTTAVIAHAIYISNFDFINTTTWLEEGETTNGILVSDYFWKKHQSFIANNARFLEINGEQKKIVGTFKSSGKDTSQDIHIVLSYDDLFNGSNKSEVFYPDEVFLIGLGDKEAPSEVLQFIENSSKLTQHDSVLDLENGVYESINDLKLKKTLKDFSELYFPFILVGLIFLGLSFSQRISIEINKDKKIITELGLKSSFKIRFLLFYFSYFFVFFAVSGLCFAVLFQPFLPNVLTDAFPVLSGGFELLQNFLIFLLIFSLSTAVLMLGILLIFSGVDSIMTSKSELLSAQLRFTFSVATCSFFVSICIALLVSGIFSLKGLTAISEQLNEDRIIVFEIQNMSMVPENMGNVVFGQSIEGLQSALEGLVVDNKIEAYSLSTMYPRLQGSTFNSMTLSDNSEIVINFNNVSGSYFDIHLGKKEFDSSVSAIPTSERFLNLANNHLYSYLTRNRISLDIVKKYSTIDIDGSFIERSTFINIKDVVPDLKYSGSLAADSFTLYGKATNSIHVKFIAIKNRFIDTMKLSKEIERHLPSDMSIRTFHNYTNILKLEIYESLLKLFFMAIIFASCLIVFFFISKLSVVGFLNSLSKNIHTLYVLGGSHSKLQLYVASCSALPLVLTIAIYICGILFMSQLDDFVYLPSVSIFVIAAFMLIGISLSSMYINMITKREFYGH